MKLLNRVLCNAREQCTRNKGQHSRFESTLSQSSSKFWMAEWNAETAHRRIEGVGKGSALLPCNARDSFVSPRNCLRVRARAHSTRPDATPLATGRDARPSGRFVFGLMRKCPFPRTRLSPGCQDHFTTNEITLSRALEVASRNKRTAHSRASESESGDVLCRMRDRFRD